MKIIKILVIAIIVIYFIVIGVVILGVMIESIIQDGSSKTIIISEQCKLGNGQVMVDELCERKIKCLDTGLFLKTCNQLKNET